jgi:hypothetical protein
VCTVVLPRRLRLHGCRASVSKRTNTRGRPTPHLSTRGARSKCRRLGAALAKRDRGWFKHSGICTYTQYIRMIMHTHRQTHIHTHTHTHTHTRARAFAMFCTHVPKYICGVMTCPRAEKPVQGGIKIPTKHSKACDELSCTANQSIHIHAHTNTQTNRSDVTKRLKFYCRGLIAVRKLDGNWVIQTRGHLLLFHRRHLDPVHRNRIHHIRTHACGHIIPRTHPDDSLHTTQTHNLYLTQKNSNNSSSNNKTECTGGWPYIQTAHSCWGGRHLQPTNQHIPKMHKPTHKIPSQTGQSRPCVIIRRIAHEVSLHNFRHGVRKQALISELPAGTLASIIKWTYA